MSFLFSAALWALPLAGLPVLLHLLLKRKTPVIPFSTLRFIRASVQRTAARRRLRQWMLLASRVILIALLVWAAAQPARSSVAGWLGGGRSSVAAVVVDTSYSMLDEDGGATRLATADAAVRQLLRTDLARATVAVFRSRPAPGQPESLQSASGLLGEWSPLRPQPTDRPLVDRVAAAVALLNRQPAGDKWLFVISDFQSREFPHPMPAPDGGRVALIDLHPGKARSAGITAVTVQPDRLIPGIGAEVVVHVIGPPREPRAVALAESNPGDPAQPARSFPPVMVTPDSTGRAEARFAFTAGSGRRTLLSAGFTAADSMPWDDRRSVVVESPRRQAVVVLDDGGAASAVRFVRLALDPGEGENHAWPVALVTRPQLTGREDVIVVPLSRWPRAPLAMQLARAAAAGKTVIVFLSPSMTDAWPALPETERQNLLTLLPSAPQPQMRVSSSHATLSDSADPMFDGLRDQSINFDAVTVRRAVPLTATADAIELLGLAPTDQADTDARTGLCFRKPVGSGICYTFATLPDGRSTNLATQPLFLPLLVRMALPTAVGSSVYNGEIGRAIVFDGSISPGATVLHVDGPDDTRYQMQLTTSQAGSHQFVFDHTDTAGLYTLHRPGSAETVAVADVSMPASESDLYYRDPATVAPAGCPLLIAGSINDLHAHVAAITQLQPQWSLPVAIVMMLLCVEAGLGSFPSWAGRRNSTSGPTAARARQSDVLESVGRVARPT